MTFLPTPTPTPTPAPPRGKRRAINKAGAPKDQTSTNDLWKFLGLLREVRAAGQYLDEALGKLETTLALTSDVARIATLREQASDTANKIEQSATTAGASLAEAVSLVDSSASLRNWISDETTKIQLNWGESSREALAVRTELQRFAGDPNAVIGDGLATDIKEAREAVRVVVVAAAMITIPPRLEEFLDDARVGATLTFKSLFENELPTESDRTEIIRRIAEAPADLPGVIDIDTASVVAISRKPGRRLRSYLLEAIALIGGGLATFLIVAASRGLYAHGIVHDGKFFQVASAEEAASVLAVGNLLLVFAGGALLHFLIDLVKVREGGKGAPRWLALDDWLLWLHAREIKVFGTIAALWFVFGGLIAVSGDLPDGLTAFFAGYSFDSLADVVIKRFDTFAAPQITKVEGVLAGT